MKTSTNLSFKRTPIIVFIAFFCLLFAMSFNILDSFALTTSHPNQLSIDNNHSATIFILEKNVNGEITDNVLSDAYFKLFKISDNNETEQLGSFVSDDAGKIFVDNLFTGEYYFQQISSPFGYSFDKNLNDEDITEYHFTINSNSESNPVINVYNRRLSGNLKIINIVDDYYGYEITTEQQNELFEFTVNFSDNKIYSYKLNGIGDLITPVENKIYLKHNDYAYFTDIPAGTTYDVDETKKSYFFASSADSQGSILGSSLKTASFLNVYYGEPIPTPNVVSVEKKVEGNPPDIFSKEFLFTTFIEEELPGYFYLKNNEKKTFIVPFGKDFSVIENNYFNEGYILSSVIEEFDAAYNEIKLTFTNKFIEPQWSTISGEKTWNFDNNNYISLPNKIIVQLKDGNNVVHEQSVYPDSNGKWEYSFVAPKFREDEIIPIVYTIDEVAVNSFETFVNGFDIENSALPPLPTTASPISVEKKITEDTPPYDEDFTFILQSFNNSPMPQGSIADKKEIIISGAGSANFGEIIFNDSGLYHYTVSEKMGDNPKFTYDDTIYNVIIDVRYNNDNNSFQVESCKYIKGSDETSYDSAVFTNEYHEFMPTPSDSPNNFNEFVSISGFKFWKHGSNPISNHPKKAQISIFADGKRILTFNVTEKSHWRWEYTLPKYNHFGKEIVYSINEVEIPDYTKTIDGFNITNSHYTSSNSDNFDSSLLLGSDNSGNYNSKNNGNYSSNSNISANTSDYYLIFAWISSLLLSALIFILLLIFIKPLTYLKK